MGGISNFMPSHAVQIGSESGKRVKMIMQYYGTDRKGFKKFNTIVVNDFGFEVRRDYWLREYVYPEDLLVPCNTSMGPAIPISQVEIALGC